MFSCDTIIQSIGFSLSSSQKADLNCKKTLSKTPYPTFSIASNFCGGREGSNLMLFAFRIPRGTVTTTQSPSYRNSEFWLLLFWVLEPVTTTVPWEERVIPCT